MSHPERTGELVAFQPSVHGWHFRNTWPAGAPAGFAGITVGRVYGGLCGGMCVLARRMWQRGEPLPADRNTPTGGALAAALWQAQLISVGLPRTPLRYLRLQSPATSAAARRSATLRRALPGVRRTLCDGRPVLLGLLKAVSWKPTALARHHVVLVYAVRNEGPGHGLPPDRVVLSIYDPNHPDDDRVALRVTPDGTISHNRDAARIYALLSLD